MIKRDKINYPGWELIYFDKANNFRNYQQNLIKEYIKGRVAEVGPGNGTNANLYHQLSYQLDLYEPTKKLSNNLKKKFKLKKNIKILNKKFSLKKNFYDTIIYFDVIEHIKNYENEIYNAYKSLKKNGHLIIMVPAFQFLYSQFDKDIDHVKRFNKDDFKKIFQKRKINNHKMFYYDSVGFFLSLVSKITSKDYKKNFGLKIKIWDKLISISKIIDMLFFFNIGKSLLVIIKK